jgi:hypothetical protein
LIVPPTAQWAIQARETFDWWRNGRKKGCPATLTNVSLNKTTWRQQKYVQFSNSLHIQEIEMLIAKANMWISIAFPNRIENGIHKQATAAAQCFLLCSWPVRLGFCFDATCINLINMVPSWNQSKLIVVSQYISTKPRNPLACPIG